MKVLVTGNNGYIGAILTKLLLEKGYSVTGLDTNYYKGCEFKTSLSKLRQITKDIRKVSKDDLRGVGAIVHLAALSNDPLCELNPEVTYDINFKASVRLARLAKKAGVTRFVFASSQSMYGITKGRMVSEDSPKKPLTAYAKSKLMAEKAISKLASNGFTPVFLRPSVVSGVSPMQRLDLVLNNLVASSVTTGRIRILSDGSPWRPIVHVEDASKAFIAALEAPKDLVQNEAFNVGRSEDNYRIREMAEAIKGIMPKCKVEYTHEHGLDSRTYRVSFGKINKRLKDYFKPRWTIKKTIKQLIKAFKAHGLTYEEFLGNKYMRLNQLKELLKEKKLSKDLYWRR